MPSSLFTASITTIIHPQRPPQNTTVVTPNLGLLGIATQQIPTFVVSLQCDGNQTT
jgi:hypothetical protein